MATTDTPKNIDEYIAGFPEAVQEILQQIRATIKVAAPEAEETISYAIPAFTLNGRYLVYFAGYKKHIGLYPVPTGNPEFDTAFAPYKTSGKGTVQFPLDKPLPLSLITRIVKFRMKENADKAAPKKAKKG
jgi:uncharacterized protein YdhG (YjbR/CyaY superfamily)